MLFSLSTLTIRCHLLRRSRHSIGVVGHVSRLSTSNAIEYFFFHAHGEVIQIVGGNLVWFLTSGISIFQSSFNVVRNAKIAPS